MALLIRYVNPDSTAGGDGTTSATTGANRAYESQNEFESVEGGNITGDSFEVRCVVTEVSPTTDSDEVTWDGWTMGASDEVRLLTPVSERHAGVVDTTKYVFEPTGGFAVPIYTPGCRNLRYEGMQLFHDNANNDIPLFYLGNNSSTFTFECTHCILKNSAPGTTNTNKHAFWGFFGTTATIKIGNNIMYDWRSTPNGTEHACVQSDQSGQTFYVYNNTMENCDVGINRVNTGSTIHAKNNIAGNMQDGECYQGTFHANSTNNTADDGTAPGSNPINGDIDYSNEAGDNYLTVAGTNSDANAIGQGSDLSADANFAFSDDVLGTARPQGAAWDRGATEVAVAGGAVDLAGTITANANLTADLLIGVDLAGTITADADLTADLLIGVELTGTITADADLTADLLRTRDLAGTITADGDLTGDLLIGVELSGTITADADLTGDLALTGAVDLAGTITADADLTGDLLRTRDLAGTITADADLTGDLALTGAVDLAGTITADADLTGDLLRTRDLAGTITADADLTGDLALSGQVELAGTITTDADLTGDLLVTRALSGTITADADLAGDLESMSFFSGPISADANLTADLLVKLSLSGSVTPAATLSAPLPLRRLCSGTVSPSANLSANLQVAGLFKEGVKDIFTAPTGVREWTAPARTAVWNVPSQDET